MDVLFFIGLGILLPLVHLPISLRLSIWIFIALLPLYQYHKAMVVSIKILDKDIQFTTITKELVSVIIVLCLIVAILAREKYLSKLPNFKLILFFVAFGLFALGSGILQKNGFMMTTMGTRPYCFYPIVALLFAGYVLQDLRDWERLANILLGGLIVFSIIALIHFYVDQQFLVLDSFKTMWGSALIPWKTVQERLYSIFPNPNRLGYLMGVGIVICLWKLFMSRNKTVDAIVLLPLAGIFLWILVLTLSRSALLAMLLGVIVLTFISGSRASRIAIILGVIAISLLLFIGPYAKRFEHLEGNARFVMWPALLKATFSTLQLVFLGHGVGSMGRFGSEIGLTGVTVAGVSAPSVESGNIFTVDNFYLRTLFELGLAGLLWTIVCFGVGFYIFYQAMKYGNRKDRLIISLPLSLATIIFSISMFSDALGAYPWSFLLWLSYSFGFTYIREKVNCNNNMLVPG